MVSQTGFTLVLFGLLNITIFITAFSLDSIIMDTKLNCSRLRNDGFATVSLTSDVDMKVILYCSNRNFTYTMPTNRISLDVPLTRQKSEVCQLEYIPTMKTYVVVMSVYRILGKKEEMFGTYRLICDKDNSTEAIVSVVVNNPFQSPQVIEHFYNQEVYINMDLEVRNIYGTKLDELTVYRKVQLYANAPKNFTGIQARECVLKTKETYIILKGGCGTGCIFRKNEGFMTKGTAVMSSYFLLPPIISKKATISCKFRVCSISCDGNSCIHK